MKSLIYYFHMKTKILVDFQISISVPLNSWKLAEFSISKHEEVTIKDCGQGDSLIFLFFLLIRTFGSRIRISFHVVVHASSLPIHANSWWSSDVAKTTSSPILQYDSNMYNCLENHLLWELFWVLCSSTFLPFKTI